LREVEESLQPFVDEIGIPTGNQVAGGSTSRTTDRSIVGDELEDARERHDFIETRGSDVHSAIENHAVENHVEAAWKGHREKRSRSERNTFSAFQTPLWRRFPRRLGREGWPLAGTRFPLQAGGERVGRTAEKKQHRFPGSRWSGVGGGAGERSLTHAALAARRTNRTSGDGDAAGCSTAGRLASRAWPGSPACRRAGRGVVPESGIATPARDLSANSSIPQPDRADSSGQELLDRACSTAAAAEQAGIALEWSRLDHSDTGICGRATPGTGQGLANGERSANCDGKHGNGGVAQAGFGRRARFNLSQPEERHDPGTEWLPSRCSHIPQLRSQLPVRARAEAVARLEAGHSLKASSARGFRHLAHLRGVPRAQLPPAAIGRDGLGSVVEVLRSDG